MHIGTPEIDEDETLRRQHRRGYVLSTPGHGVFLTLVDLPHLGPTGLWSKGTCTWSHLMPDEAVVFPDMQTLLLFADQLEPPPTGLEVTEVQVSRAEDGILYASVDACTAAGLPEWMTHATEPINTIPL